MEPLSARPNPLAFKFLINKQVGRGPYIKAKAEGNEWILAQVEDVKRSNSAYSVNQLNDAARNYDSRETMIAEARVIGVGSNGKLHLPTSPARPGDSVFIADEKLIKATLGLAKGDMYIGMLRGYDIRVELDANTLVQKHCSVLAKTGSGKSYTAAVILEELLDRKVALLVIDPHGEYASMKEPNKEGDFAKYKIKPRGYDVIVYTPGEMAMNPRADRPFRFNGLNLSAREVAKMIPHESASSGQLGLLYEAISALRAETDAYTLEDVIEQVVRSNSKVKWNLVGQLESLLELGLFSGSATPREELLRPGKASVIDMTGILPGASGHDRPRLADRHLRGQETQADLARHGCGGGGAQLHPGAGHGKRGQHQHRADHRRRGAQIRPGSDDHQPKAGAGGQERHLPVQHPDHHACH